jgi:hypothetical protein
MRYSLTTGIYFGAARAVSAALLVLSLPACGFGESADEGSDEATSTVQAALSPAEQAC